MTLHCIIQAFLLFANAVFAVARGIDYLKK